MMNSREYVNYGALLDYCKIKVWSQQLNQYVPTVEEYIKKNKLSEDQAMRLMVDTKIGHFTIGIDD